jgi:tetratricopeptide (TPR) repeat protein
LAITAYQKALSADNGFVEARNGLGVIYSTQGKYREAIDVFQLAIQQAPKVSYLYSNMGYAYYLQGKYTESVAALEQATLLDPNNIRAINNLAQAHAKSGNIDKSTQTLVQVPSGPGVSSEATTASNLKPAYQSETQLVTPSEDRDLIKPASSNSIIAEESISVKRLNQAPNVTELQFQLRNTELVAHVAEKMRLEVANGNGLTGAAKKVGKYLLGNGYPIARLTNQKPFHVQMTQIQYREGYQAEAQLLKLNIPYEAELLQRKDMKGNVSIRLVLGKDMLTHIAQYEHKDMKIQLALNASRI